MTKKSPRSKKDEEHGGMYVCSGLMTLITAMFLHTRSQDALQSVSVRGVHVVLSTTGFNGGENSHPSTRETASPRRGIQKPRALSWDRNETIGAQAHGFTN